MNQSQSSVSRREALKAVGVGSLGYTINTDVVSAVEPKERIVTDRGGMDDKPIAKEKVPKRWHAHEIEMRRVYDTAFQKISGIRKERGLKQYIHSMALEGSDVTVDGYVATQPTVEISDSAPQGIENSLPRDLPSLGISPRDRALTDEIRYERRSTESALTCGGVDFETSDGYFGGIVIDTENGEDGTSGYRVYDSDNEYILTANHLFSGKCSDNSEGKAATQTNGKAIGTVSDAHAYHDWALVKNADSSPTSLTNEVYHGGNDYYKIAGYKTRDGISSLVDSRDEAYKCGSGTGEERGTIRSYNQGGFTGCPKYDKDGVRTEVNNAVGDSGGPVYDLIDCGSGECKASIIHNMSKGKKDTGNTACDGDTIFKYSVGWPTYKIVNNTSYAVGNTVLL